MGIDGPADAGLQIAKFHEYFDLNTGDILQYESFYIDAGSGDHFSRSSKFLVISKTAAADYISLQISYVTSFTYLNFPPVQSNGTGILTIYRDSFPFTEEYNYDTVSPHLTSLFPMPFAYSIQNFNDNPLAFFQLYKPSLKIFTRTFYDDNSVYTKSFGNYYSTKIAGSIMTDVPGYPNLMQNDYADNFSETYKIGLGQTDFVFSFFERTEETHLTAYCKNGDTVGVFMPGSFVGLNEPAIGSINIFPSPASDKLYIHTATLYAEHYDISIFSLNGTIHKPQCVLNNDLIIVDIKNLAPGFYFLELHSGSQRMCNKFIKE